MPQAAAAHPTLASQSLKRSASESCGPPPANTAGPSPFSFHSAAELGIAVPGAPGPCCGADAPPARADSEDRCDGCEDAACCGGGEPPAKRTKQEEFDSQAAVDAAIADGAIVISSKPASGETMACQVAGCGKDLSGLKDYHQRYHVCEKHIKLPAIVKVGRKSVAGVEGGGARGAW